MKVVMVCGIARSGTSMTCGILQALGIPFHQTIFEKSQVKFNPKGHFEDYDLIPIMQGAQKEFKPIIRAQKIPSKDRVQTWVNHCKPQMMQIANRQNCNGLWGFKCQSKYALDVFAKMFDDFHVVVVTRPIEDQAHSYRNLVVNHHRFPRKNYSFEDSLRDVTQAVNDMITMLDRLDIKKSYTTYETIRKFPVEVAKRLAEEIGIEMTDDAIRLVDEFVDPQIRSWK